MGQIGPTPQASANIEKPQPTQRRFGIGEWYGRPFFRLTAEERRHYASMQTIPKDKRPAQPCPFQSRAGKTVNCGKAGGVCSLLSYERSPATGDVSVDSQRNTIRTVCPNRFEENGTIYRWIGETLISNADALAVGETPFLRPLATMGPTVSKLKKNVGRIDNVLATPGTTPLQWCPVEKQAVYFSGRKMGEEFSNIESFEGSEIPFPVHNRRPDYRSSQPKRLLPQLQIKVPALRTWGKKMAVVVDEDFFYNLGQMKEEDDLSNAEVVWFVVKFVDTGTVFRLERFKVFMTKLEEARDGLVAGKPLPLREFEKTIITKIKKATAQNS
jgi:hypothetical protein